MLRSVMSYSAPMLSIASRTTARRIVAPRTLHSVSPMSFQSKHIKFIRPYSGSANKLNEDEVTKRITDVVKAFNKTSAINKVDEKTSFQTDLGLDSLDTVELLVAIEEEFEIEIPDKVADELKTVGETVKFILTAPEAN